MYILIQKRSFFRGSGSAFDSLAGSEKLSTKKTMLHSVYSFLFMAKDESGFLNHHLCDRVRTLLGYLFSCLRLKS